MTKVFNNFTLKSTLTSLSGTAFGNLFGFGMIVSNNTRYYISDTVYYETQYINILNDQWQFINFVNFNNPTYMITLGNSLFISGSNNIWKTDLNLKVLGQYNRTDNPYYQGIFYNSNDGFLYAAANKKSAVHIFNTSLTLVDSFATTSYYPWSISVFNNLTYVGCMTSGTILVVVNKQISKTFNGCNGNGDDVKSITFDQSGYMAISCSITGQVFLYNNNSVYTGKNIPIINPMFSGFDSIGRFVVVSKDRISLYY